MSHSAKALLLALLLAAASLAQNSDLKPGTSKSPGSDKAAAYYNFAMGRLYAELAGASGNRGEYVSKAIEHYRQAIKLDPAAGFLVEELTELYVQAGRIRDAITEAEEMLRQNPDNLDARRILGRIYSRMIGDPQQGKIDENMLKRAIDQYQRVTEKAPKDLDSWLILGRLHKANGNSVDSEKAYNQALAIDPNNEEALTGLAIVYSDIGDTNRAIEKLRQLAERNPNPRALAALASSYEQIRDYKSAAQVLKRALQMQPGNTRLKRALAQDLLFSDSDDEALQLYKELVQEDPKDVQAHLRISEIYRQKRDFANARAALEKAKQLDPDGVEVRYDEVNLLDAEGKSEQAIALLKGILDQTAKKMYSPAEKNNRNMLLERLGVLYQSSGQYAQAVDAFRQIGELDPSTGARVAAQIIETYRAARDYTKAQQEAEAARKKYPEERVIKLVYASVLADLGRIDEAAAEVRALLKGERDLRTYLSLAQIYEKGKRYADVGHTLDEAEKLVKSDQERELIHFQRGAMYERQKKYDAAEAEFRKVLAINPDSASALNYLGYMFADRGVRLEEAQKLITRALELDPDNGAYLDSLGWVYYRQNRLSEAEDLLIRALAKVGKDPTIHDHLGDVYFKQGKTKEAITQWHASLKEWQASPKSEIDPVQIAEINKKLENARIRLARETGKK